MTCQIPSENVTAIGVPKNNHEDAENRLVGPADVDNNRDDDKNDDEDGGVGTVWEDKVRKTKRRIEAEFIVYTC